MLSVSFLSLVVIGFSQVLLIENPRKLADKQTIQLPGFGQNCELSLNNMYTYQKCYNLCFSRFCGMTRLCVKISCRLDRKNVYSTIHYQTCIDYLKNVHPQNDRVNDMSKI